MGDASAPVRMRLSLQMLAVLETIIEPRLDDEPFPPTVSVKALEQRGLIRLVGAREAAANGAGTMDIIMASLGAERIVATVAGHRAYWAAKAAHLEAGGRAAEHRLANTPPRSPATPEAGDAV